MKTFEEFMKAMQTDSELEAKAKAALEALEEKTEEAKLAVVVKLAQENGYDVSVEDFSAAQAGEHKMDSAEMDLLAGGGVPFFSCGTNDECCAAWNFCESEYLGNVPGPFGA